MSGTSKKDNKITDRTKNYRWEFREALIKKGYYKVIDRSEKLLRLRDREKDMEDFHNLPPEIENEFQLLGANLGALGTIEHDKSNGIYKLRVEIQSLDGGALHQETVHIPEKQGRS